MPSRGHNQQAARVARAEAQQASKAMDSQTGSGRHRPGSLEVGHRDVAVTQRRPFQACLALYQVCPGCWTEGRLGGYLAQGELSCSSGLRVSADRCSETSGAGQVAYLQLDTAAKGVGRVAASVHGAKSGRNMHADSSLELEQSLRVLRERRA